MELEHNFYYSQEVSIPLLLSPKHDFMIILGPTYKTLGMLPPPVVKKATPFI